MTSVQVYEYDFLEVRSNFKKEHLKVLADYQNNRNPLDFPYYSVTKNGIQFNSYIGVIYLNDLTIEVLPKLYKAHNKMDGWHDRLVFMLSAVYKLNMGSFSDANQRTRNDIPILDFLLDTFLSHTAEIMRSGLVKKYNMQEDNMYCLKGRLMFGKHITNNPLHQERFYVNHTVYNYNNIFNSILKQTLEIIPSITNNTVISNLAKRLMQDFPNVKSVQISSDIFSQLQYDRKTEDYRKAISMAEMLLLNYFTDFSAGGKTMMALMFDMNDLWEKFVFASLANYSPDGYTFKYQASEQFWKSETGVTMNIRPDIICKKENGDSFILDTKWKNIQNNNNTPSSDDLYQIYSYRREFLIDGNPDKIRNVALVYPATNINDTNYIKGFFNNPDISCDLIFIPFFLNIDCWQREIATLLTNWCNNKQKCP